MRRIPPCTAARSLSAVLASSCKRLAVAARASSSAEICWTIRAEARIDADNSSGFVHETLRDALRQGDPRAIREDMPRLDSEVSADVGDHPRRQSYGS